MQENRTVEIAGLSSPEVEFLRAAFGRDADMYAEALEADARADDRADAERGLSDAEKVLEALDDGQLEGAAGYLRATVFAWADEAMGGVQDKAPGAIERVMTGLELVRKVDAHAV